LPPPELPPVEEFPLDGVGVIVGAVDALGAGVVNRLGATGAGFGALVTTGFATTGFATGGFGAGAFGFATLFGAVLRATFFATFLRAVFFLADFFTDFFFAADLRVTFRATFLRAILAFDFTRTFLDFAAFFAERFFFDAFFAAIVMPPDSTRFALP
jgi:hypothetical protein